MTGATAADAGSYDVIVTGTCGSVTSTAVSLTINTAPTITTQPTAQAVCSGANAAFTVTATGSGTLAYQWRKGGINISGATASTYTIASVTAADAANYDVVITNGCGSVTSNSVALTLNAATTIVTQP
ncbi:MAG: phage tail protein, partial [Chitinophagaceae bacterium]